MTTVNSNSAATVLHRTLATVKPTSDGRQVFPPGADTDMTKRLRSSSGGLYYVEGTPGGATRLYETGQVQVTPTSRILAEDAFQKAAAENPGTQPSVIEVGHHDRPDVTSTFFKTGEGDLTQMSTRAYDITRGVPSAVDTADIIHARGVSKSAAGLVPKGFKKAGFGELNGVGKVAKVLAHFGLFR